MDEVEKRTRSGVSGVWEGVEMDESPILQREGENKESKSIVRTEKYGLLEPSVGRW